MEKRNQSTITEFLLLGFGDLHNFKILIFTLVLIVHIATLTANVLVIVLVGVIPSLHSPMYFFLSQLSFCDILFTSNIVPTMLWLILVGRGKISVARCITQFYFLGVPITAQCLLLAAMSFDRYVAICRPLHYATIMNLTHQLQMVTSCWLLGVTLKLILCISLSKLIFCNLNTIDHFSCDIAPLLQLSCSNTLFVELLTAVLAFPIILSPFIFIVATYISIIRTILNIPSTTGRHKAFSTCSSHLIIVCTYYGTLSSIYMFPPKDSSVNVNKSLSVVYTLLTPLFNPLIYSLRNKDLRNAIFKCIKCLRVWKPIQQFHHSKAL